MNTKLWYFADAESNGPGYKAVVDSEGYTICPPVPISIAAEIVKAHNSRDALVSALRDLLDECDVADHLSKKITDAAAAALAAAGVQQAGAPAEGRHV